MWVKRPKIAVISFNGVMAYSDDPESKMFQLETNLRRVKNGGYEAIVLRMNTPGGTSGAGEAVYLQLLGLQEKGIKIVIHMEDVVASAGLLAAMGGDIILAHGMTITGSIGVITESFEYSDLLEGLGVSVNTTKSGKYKDTPSSYRKMEKEERELMKAMSDEIHERFIEMVYRARESRDISREEVEKIADGSTFTGARAQKLKLVDGIGEVDDAIDVACELIDWPRDKVSVKYFSNKERFLGRFKKTMPIPFSPFSGLADCVVDCMTSFRFSNLPLLRMSRFPRK